MNTFYSDDTFTENIRQAPHITIVYVLICGSCALSNIVTVCIIELMEPSKRGRGRAKKIESRVSNPKTGSRNADTNENKSGRGRGRADVRKTQKRQNDTPKSESHNEEDDSSGSEMEEEWNHGTKI